MSPREHACPLAARVWPYLAAFSLVAGTVVAVAHVGRRAAGLPGWSTARLLVLLVALVAAIVIVRLGEPLQWRVRVEAGRLALRRGARRRELPLASIAQLGWQPIGSTRRSLVSALTIEDDAGTLWRLPALYADGARLVDELARAAAREDLEAWCEALRLRARMGRVRPRLAGAYVALAGWIAAVAVFVAR